MEETQKEKQAVPEPIDIITLLHDVLRGVKKLWWACLLLTVLCAAGSWYTAKRAYRPMYRAAASFTVATGSGESGGFSYGFYYNTATASQLARTFPYILESELLTDSIKQALGTDYITASLSASAVEDSNLFTLTATGANAESTLNVLNAAIDCYPEAARYVLGDIKLHMLNAPSLPTTPYNIFDGKRAALTGAAYGLLFGAGLVLLYGCTRRTVRREEEIASKLHLLCLGTLPKVVFKKRSKNRRETLTLTNPHVPEHYREAARGLAMRLERRMAASGDKVVGIAVILKILTFLKYVRHTNRITACVVFLLTILVILQVLPHGVNQKLHMAIHHKSGFIRLTLFDAPKNHIVIVARICHIGSIY